MPNENRPLKVFLCHARSDADRVHVLYSQLTRDGVDVWLDKVSLVAGQDWEYEIPKAVRSSDIVVVCHSKQFNQQGYRQKEVKIALDAADYLPKGEIFIVPVRLEECDVLDDLKRWQWVDLFEANGYDNLIRALQLRANSIGATLQVKRGVLPRITTSRSLRKEVDKANRVKNQRGKTYDSTIQEIPNELFPPIIKKPWVIGSMIFIIALLGFYLISPLFLTDHTRLTPTVTLTKSNTPPSTTTHSLEEETITPTITQTESTLTGKGYINKAFATVWQEPNSVMLEKVVLNQSLDIVDAKTVYGDKWYRCRYEIDGETKEGWIHGDFVTFGFVVTTTPTITPTPQTTPLPLSYINPLIVFDQEMPLSSNCWLNEGNDDISSSSNGFSRRSDNYWRFTIEKNLSTDEFIQTDFGNCIDVTKINAIAINMSVARLEMERYSTEIPEPGREIGIFLEDSIGSRREYTIWIDRENNYTHLKIRVDGVVISNDVVFVINDEALKITEAFPRLYATFPIQIFLEINNQGLDIIYLNQGFGLSPISAQDIEPSGMIIIDKAVMPTSSPVQKIGLIGYGGETQAVIWPLVFYGE